MNNQIPLNPTCEAFELDISAMLDGELDGPQKAALGRHLIQCKSCRQTVRDFETADQLALVESNYFAETPRLNLPSELPDRKSRFKFIGAVAAAVLAASVVFVIWLNSQETNQQTASVQLVKPISELQQISVQRQHNQELKLKAMELELRRLSLQLAELEDESQQSDMQAKLDIMLNRIFKEQFVLALD